MPIKICNPKELPSIELLCELYSYEPETGLLIRKITRANYLAGTPAGFFRKHSMHVDVQGRELILHRVAWAIHTGSWPSGIIDHIDGNPRNNRWTNLRVVDHQTNAQNIRSATKKSTTGVLGVFKTRSGYKSQVNVKGKIHYLGTFSTPEAAHEAYLKAKRELHPGCTL